MARLRSDPIARLLARTEITDSCWLWTGPTGDLGYSRVWVDGKGRHGHRVMYEAEIGPVPDGMTLDHLCRVRNCINPAHLEVVSRAENVLRGEGLTAQNARKKRCPKGHRLSGENLYISQKGRRECRICRRAQVRKFRAKAASGV